MNTIRWDDLRYFLAVRRSASYTRAGRQLHVNSTTVARRIAALERALETTLFERGVHGLGPTAEAELLQAHAERVESEMLASERALRGRDARLDGELTLTAGDGVMRYLIIPWLLDLRRSHPDLRLQLRSDNRPLDLARREADVALRLFRPREASLIATRVAHFPFAVYAGRTYLARRGSPRRIADLAAEDWLGWDDELSSSDQSRWLAKRFPGARLRLQINTTNGLIAACALGHGLAVLPTFAAAHEPSLVRVAARSQPPARDLWLVTHTDSRRNARVRAVRSWLSERFARSWPPPAAG